MSVLYWVFIICLQAAIWLLIAVPLWRYAVTEYSAKQLAQQAGGSRGTKVRWIYRFREELAVLRLGMVTICALLTVSFLNQLYGPWTSFGWTLLLLIIAAFMAKLSFMIDSAENILLKNIVYVQVLVKHTSVALRPFTRFFAVQSLHVGSHDEFIEELRRLPSTVLTPHQKQRIETVITADTKTVKDIMTPKKRVVTVEPSATLGPILLSDLEKSEHGFFPVATKKEEPKGILQLRDVADIHDAKQKVHVRELMKDHIVWVADDTNLIALTDLFLKAKQHILFVRNPEGEFAGIVTVADLIKHLVGIVAE